MTKDCFTVAILSDQCFKPFWYFWKTFHNQILHKGYWLCWVASWYFTRKDNVSVPEWVMISNAAPSLAGGRVGQAFGKGGLHLNSRLGSPESAYLEGWLSTLLMEGTSKCSRKQMCGRQRCLSIVIVEKVNLFSYAAHFPRDSCGLSNFIIFSLLLKVLWKITHFVLISKFNLMFWACVAFYYTPWNWWRCFRTIET